MIAPRDCTRGLEELDDEVLPGVPCEAGHLLRQGLGGSSVPVGRDRHRKAKLVDVEPGLHRVERDVQDGVAGSPIRLCPEPPEGAVTALRLGGHEHRPLGES